MIFSRNASKNNFVELREVEPEIVTREELEERERNRGGEERPDHEEGDEDDDDGEVAPGELIFRMTYA